MVDFPVPGRPPRTVSVGTHQSSQTQVIGVLPSRETPGQQAGTACGDDPRSIGGGSTLITILASGASCGTVTDGYATPGRY